MNNKEVMQQALEALITAEAGLSDIGDADREPGDDVAWCESRAAQALAEPRKAITYLRAALAQPEPEPVAWRYDEATYRPNDLRGRQWHFNLFSTHKPYPDDMVQNVTPLYTAPPQRKPLTEEQMYEILGYGAMAQYNSVPQYAIECVRAIERAHGIGGEE